MFICPVVVVCRCRFTRRSDPTLHDLRRYSNTPCERETGWTWSSLLGSDPSRRPAEEREVAITQIEIGVDDTSNNSGAALLFGIVVLGVQLGRGRVAVGDIAARAAV